MRAFGFHPWAIVLPQAIEGVLTVLVLYHAVSRLAGTAAGLIAALILAVSPATVALDRGNISDSLLILLLVLAADAVSGAITAGAKGSRPLGEGIGGLVLAAVWVGLAFQTKMIQAWMVMPALGLAYLLCGPGSVGRRTAQLAFAGTLTALVSLSWMIAVSLVPQADRPYVDGSHNDSIFEQVFVYNGFGRFGDQTPQQLLADLARSGRVLRPVSRFRRKVRQVRYFSRLPSQVSRAWCQVSRLRCKCPSGPHWRPPGPRRFLGQRPPGQRPFRGQRPPGPNPDQRGLSSRPRRGRRPARAAVRCPLFRRCRTACCAAAWGVIPAG